MSEFLRLLLDSVEFLWPFKRVQEWERGCLYVWGHYWRTVGPGIYLVVPWFMRMIEVSVVPGIHWTPLQTITLADGRQLTFSLSVTYHVEDPERATNLVERYEETMVEFAAGMVAEELATVDPSKFEPKYGKRDRLLEALRLQIDNQMVRWGVRCTALRFTNFAVGLRTYRLLTAAPTLTI